MRFISDLSTTINKSVTNDFSAKKRKRKRKNVTRSVVAQSPACG